METGASGGSLFRKGHPGQLLRQHGEWRELPLVRAVKLQKAALKGYMNQKKFSTGVREEVGNRTELLAGCKGYCQECRIDWGWTLIPALGSTHI